MFGRYYLVRYHFEDCTYNAVIQCVSKYFQAHFINNIIYLDIFFLGKLTFLGNLIFNHSTEINGKFGCYFLYRSIQKQCYLYRFSFYSQWSIPCLRTKRLTTQRQWQNGYSIELFFFKIGIKILNLFLIWFI